MGKCCPSLLEELTSSWWFEAQGYQEHPHFLWAVEQNDFYQVSKNQDLNNSTHRGHIFSFHLGSSLGNLAQVNGRDVSQMDFEVRCDRAGSPVGQTKWLVFRMIHVEVSRPWGKVWSTWTSWGYVVLVPMSQYSLYYVFFTVCFFNQIGMTMSSKK